MKNYLELRHFIWRWKGMMDRCYDPECAAYSNYGARGITVCDEWFDPFQYASDLPRGFFKGAELDRIDNNGNYQPDNVRWVTRLQNSNNRRTSYPITFQGTTQSLSEWSRCLGINLGTLNTRLYELNWTVEKTFTTAAIGPHERMSIARAVRLAAIVKKPPRPKRVFNTVSYNGCDITMAELSAICGVATKTLSKRIFERGWSVEKAIVPPKPK